jgi:hypothetical protein
MRWERINHFKVKFIFFPAHCGEPGSTTTRQTEGDIEAPSGVEETQLTENERIQQRER